jgi:RNA polymerase sigma-70 factor (ECF subfamily)
VIETPFTLLLRLKNRSDHEAWRQFVQLYAPLLRIWADHTGLQDSDAEDLVQEVLIVTIHELPRFEYDRSGSFRGWLRRICENKANEFRRRRRVVGRQTGDTGLDAAASPDQIELFWEREYAAVLTARALQLMQGEFEETTWRACWELTVHERSAADVAAELGISPNACFIAKSRVLRRLRELLGNLL